MNRITLDTVETFNAKKIFFSEIPQSTDMTMHETLSFLKFLQTKPHIERKNINYCDLYYNIILNSPNEEGEN